MTDTIDALGDPLVFKVRQGNKRSPLLAGVRGSDIIKVEARQMAHHQKEAIVTEGAHGSAWRVTSDEGLHLKGTDLAPFPLGFFNAGLHGDLYRRIHSLAAAHDVALDGVEINLINGYWLTGSFLHGTGEGHAEPTEIDVRVTSAATPAAVGGLIRAALDASPAIALLRAALTSNTFALYINGRRRQVDGVANSTAPDAVDPYRAYTSAPRPIAGAALRTDLIEKTGRCEDGQPVLAVPNPAGRVIRTVVGKGHPVSSSELYEVETWLAMPGASHFRFRSDVGATDAAPSGLALLSAGIAFCYMTQLARYIESMKMKIHGVRLVQFNPYAVDEHRAVAGPIDTHLFLNGEAKDETHMKLLTIAARTCYLHATAVAPLEPVVRVLHNGVPLGATDRAQAVAAS